MAHLRSGCLLEIPGVTARSAIQGRLLAAALVLGALSTGCTSVAQVTTLSSSPCHDAMLNGLTAILIEQDEDPQLAGQLAGDATQALEAGGFGPRPFLLASPTGVDYSFFVQSKDGECLLRLYGRDKGFTSYTNNLTYIATRPLAPCRCSE